jgi:hypothetical protein
MNNKLSLAGRFSIVTTMFYKGFFCNCCPEIERVLVHDDLQYSPDEYDIKHADDCEGHKKVVELLGVGE